MDVENTDLERRVLAHEQILQVLIAHMAEAEPRFLDRLQEIFTKHHTLGANEQDYTDTAAYAEQFIHQVVRLRERVLRDRTKEAAPRTSPPPPGSFPAGHSSMNFDDSAEHRSQAARFPPPSKYTNSPVGKGQPGAPDDMAWPSRTRHQSQRPRSGSLACAPPRRPVNKHRR